MPNFCSWTTSQVIPSRENVLNGTIRLFYAALYRFNVLSGTKSPDPVPAALAQDLVSHSNLIAIWAQIL